MYINCMIIDMPSSRLLFSFIHSAVICAYHYILEHTHTHTNSSCVFGFVASGIPAVIFFSLSIGVIIIHAYSILCTRTDNSNYVAMFMDCICTTFCFYYCYFFFILPSLLLPLHVFPNGIELEGVAKGLT